MNQCITCDNTYEGNYCNNCGQKLITKRFTLKESIFWIFSSIFNFDKGFLYTTKELIIRPGTVINQFLKGSTVKHAHPFRFLFIWATLSAIIGVYFNIYEESSVAINKFAGQSEEDLERTRKLSIAMKEYMSFVMMGMVPFFALGSYMISKKKGLNFAEHLIMFAYGSASSIVIGLPILLAYFFIPNTSVLSTISFCLGILVMGRVLAQTLKDNYVIGILKYIFSFIIAIIVSVIVGIIAVLIYALIMKSLGLGNPFANI